eukprot:INCI8273.3.p1 GENE.INCI8273.3~~INCI8273.3.p1  ORF type:complete len:470 (+),score=149.55 INCI8273.3:194-1603(+)
MASNQQQQPLRIERSEWERIKRRANAASEASTSRSPAVQARLNKSQARVQNWGNTLAASRQQKLEHRRRQEEEAEARRVAVDEEEEQIRAKLRKQAIDRATQLMYEQQDQIKRMRSKQIVADSLEIQQEQRKNRGYDRRREQEREAYFHEKVLEQVQAAADREAREAEELARKRAEVTKVQAQQLEFHTKRHVQRLVEEREEGEEMLRQAQRAIEEERRKKEARENQLKANNREMAEANRKLQILKEKERLKFEEEQRKIAQYAADKEKRKAKREAHMRYKHELKQKSIQKMIDKAVDHLESLKTDEDFRVERDVKLADAALAKREQDKIDRRRAEMEACDRSRQHQLERKRVLRQEELEADRNMVAEWMDHNDRMKMKELQKQQRLREIKERNAKGLLQLTASQKRALQKQREDERLSEQEIFRKSDQNALEFEEYLHKQVEEYRKAGKNTKALQSALKAAPDLLPAM